MVLVIKDKTNQEMAKQGFYKGDQVNLAIIEGGRHKMKRMEIVQARETKLHNHSGFEYQVKRNDSVRSAELYEDENGKVWFKEDELMWPPTE